MHPPISAERWAAMRDLNEGAPGNLARIAAAVGVHDTTVRERASRERWRVPRYQKADNRWAKGDRVGAMREKSLAVLAKSEQTPAVKAFMARLGGEAAAPFVPEAELAVVLEAVADETPEQRAARLIDLLLGHCDLLLAQARAQGGTLTRAQMETMSAMLKLADKLETLAQERAVQEEIKSDDEIASALELIDRRIVELAHEHAGQLGRTEPD